MNPVKLSPSSLVSSSPLNVFSYEMGRSKIDKTHLAQKKSLENTTEKMGEGTQKNGYFTRKKAIAIGAAGCLLAAVALTARYALGGTPPPPPLLPNCPPLVPRINDFSQKLLSLMPKNESLWISPPTIISVLGLMFAGLSTKEQEASSRLLQSATPLNTTEFISCLGNIAAQTDAKNAIVLNKNTILKIKKSFLQLIKDYKITMKTEDTLELDQLVLRSQNEFKGKWGLPFDPKDTWPGQFYFEGNKQMVELMRQTGSFKYYEGSDFKMIEIPYKEKSGRFYKKLIFLPNNAKQLGALEKHLTDDFIKKCMRGAQTQEVDLIMPKLHIQKEYKDIKTILQKIGVLPTYIFSEINDDPLSPLMLKKVAHETTLKENEEESIATSKTEAHMSLSAPSPRFHRRTFHANHNFHHCIIDQNGLILFRGNVKDPSVFTKSES